MPHHVFAGAPGIRSLASLDARASSRPFPQWSWDATLERGSPAGRSFQPRSSAAESTEQLVDTMGCFGIAKPAVREWNARPRPRMPEHLLTDWLTDQLRLRDPGVTGHASQRGLEFSRQVHRHFLHAIHSTPRVAVGVYGPNQGHRPASAGCGTEGVDLMDRSHQLVASAANENFDV